ncbi:MAG: galactokinase family protein [Candidatus Hydrogenedentota bacterium]
MTAGGWLNVLTRPEPAVREHLRACYGADEAVIAARCDLLRRVLARFVSRFGDRPVRVFRAPARINLRGMHVDTHGGYLNLMTHQRETVVVAAQAVAGVCTFVNAEDAFPEVTFDLAALMADPAFGGDWPDFLERCKAPVPGWGAYLAGAVLRAHHGLETLPTGIDAAIGSDIPRGAALSSSHALTLAMLDAALVFAGRRLAPSARILATRDAEWYTGARTGTSDQGAMILGGRDTLVNAVLHPDHLELDTVRRVAFPEALRVLVVNSHTTRNLSGAEAVAYNRNRFAYSLGLAILRQELQGAGYPPAAVEHLDRFSRVTPEALGGVRVFYETLRRVPCNIAFDELRARYDLPGLGALYARYFSQVDTSQRPDSFNLRGPLLFGVTESLRAQRFAAHIESGHYARAGRLMVIGHAGDRVYGGEWLDIPNDVSDAALDRLAHAEQPVETCPGQYGASAPALDALVDASLRAGALGACLTGAGIAGSVLALCRAEDAGNVAQGVRACLASAPYARLAKREQPLSAAGVERAVVENCATTAAGELTLGGAHNGGE